MIIISYIYFKKYFLYNLFHNNKFVLIDVLHFDKNDFYLSAFIQPQLVQK